MVVHAYNPNIQEAEARGAKVEPQSGLHRQTLSENSNRKAQRPFFD
jgi:hypothetical protein